MRKLIKSILIFVFFCFIYAADGRIKYPSKKSNKVIWKTPTAKIGDNPFPTNPLNDRGKGYLLQGKIKNAITNYGSFINWDHHPAGLWGEYAYLPAVAFLAGVPGYKQSYEFNWNNIETIVDEEGATLFGIWESASAYDAWFVGDDTTFSGIIFEAENDDGLYIPENEKSAIDQFNGHNQFMFDHDSKKIILSLFGSADPNKSSARTGFIYPWALRPKLKSREEQFDYYDYGIDQEEWTTDDPYMYYGANVAESWFSRTSNGIDTDWQASTGSRVNTHNTETSVGDIFYNTPFSDEGDSYPALAHSGYSNTWPIRLNENTGLMESFWPGSWSQDYNINLPGCSNSRKDPDCWEEIPGRFISDMDVYMEFDDRWSHRANNVNTNNEYEQTGYPMGIRVMATAHSYGVSYAEDIMFVTVKVRNESGDWCAKDENGNALYDDDGNQLCGEAMIMPDGTKLNRGKGFDYKGMTLGFYMDADVLVGDINGYNSGLHTNDDDFMKYYWESFEVNNERMLISMAMIGDHDGISAVPGYPLDTEDVPVPGSNFGVVATQLLDSPRATVNIDLDQDGTIDIFPGEPLKMTDWHWVDWYARPGVIQPEGNQASCLAGDPGCPVARNKEEILYKLMTGDTTNLTEGEKAWHFHTSNPGTDLPSDLNPHFDSVEGLKQEPVYLRDPPGLDCVLILSCGPFDLPVGREVPFSFCIIYGQTEDDLINNARFAQVMYNSKYQGFTPPSRPKVYTETGQGEVRLFWNNHAENSRDVVTGYADFEGYKIYKSLDGGKTWGNADDMIFDNDGIFVGWRPYQQFDLSAEQDSLHCAYTNNNNCDRRERRGHSISGQDPYFPWFNLGDDTGFEEISLDEPAIISGDTMHYMFIDQNVVNGIEYTYSVVAYDMGVEPPFITRFQDLGNGRFEAIVDTNYSNPDQWANPEGYAAIENSKGTTVLDRNFVKVYPGVLPKDNLRQVGVVPNPYIVRSGFNESEYIRQIRFTNLPEKCEIKIYTITGEYVNTVSHNNPESGNEWWDMRTINNQELAPGLYLFYVNQKDDSGNTSDTAVGKFAVIR
ncbi:MAG: hypothetical protein CMG74_10715 [Candidatus Marinimicrobia bacterium]|nr:hypothetical protein [Candidatus Neomarinimicrobiota bacterium]|tara:strand:+ start:1105 stop:4284 length:3180 start_codon:yes stop_codon:yes gene_type:complete